MSKLPLAVDIADTVTDAQEAGERIDVGAKANELRRVHPEADVTVGEVAEAIEETIEASEKPTS